MKNEPLVQGQAQQQPVVASTYGSNAGTVAQPPAAQAQAVPQAQYAPQQVNVTISTGGAAIVNPGAYVYAGNTRMFRGSVPDFFSKKPVRAQCPACMNETTTIPLYKWGGFAFAWYICFLILCWPLALLPWCFPMLFCDVIHMCQFCRCVVGRKPACLCGSPPEGHN